MPNINLKNLINKKFTQYAETKIKESIEFMDTGIPTINYLISGRPVTGGIPYSGKVIMLYGAEGCGKTSLVCHLISEALKNKQQVLFIDTEHSLEKNRFLQFNIDLNDENFNYVEPTTMEEAFDILFELCKSMIANKDNSKLLVVWDSIANTPTQEMMSRKADDVEYASQAKVLNRDLVIYKALVSKTNIGTILINQARDNMARYGDIISFPGGKTLRHNCDCIIRVSKHDQNESSQLIKFKTPMKNRFFSPFQETSIKFDYVDCFKKEYIIESFIEFLKQIEFLCSAGAYLYWKSDVLALAQEHNMTEDEVLDSDFYKDIKKHRASEIIETLMNDPEGTNNILRKTEEYINVHIAKIKKMTANVELMEDELKKQKEETGESNNILIKDIEDTKKIKKASKKSVVGVPKVEESSDININSVV